MLHENASVKKIKNEQIIFLCLIKLDSLNRKIYLHYCLWYYKAKSLDTVRASEPEIPNPNKKANRKLPIKEL